MAELTQEIIDIVENTNLPEDIRQDFYVSWLESSEKEFEDKDYLKKYINAALHNDLVNMRAKDTNRRKLEEENDDLIRNTYGYNDVGADPLDVLLAEELEDEMIGSLSDLEKEIYARVLGNGVPYKDVASELNMSEEAVRQHVSRIKRKFNGKTNEEEQENETTIEAA